MHIKKGNKRAWTIFLKYICFTTDVRVNGILEEAKLLSLQVILLIPWNLFFIAIIDKVSMLQSSKLEEPTDPASVI